MKPLAADQAFKHLKSCCMPFWIEEGEGMAVTASGKYMLRAINNPATRNRTRDHLITAQIYSQMLCQLSYSRYESAETGTAIKGFSSSCHWLSRTLHGVVESFLGGSNLWIRSSKPESIPETMV